MQGSHKNRNGILDHSWSSPRVDEKRISLHTEGLDLLVAVINDVHPAFLDHTAFTHMVKASECEQGDPESDEVRGEVRKVWGEGEQKRKAPGWAPLAPEPLLAYRMLALPLSLLYCLPFTSRQGLWPLNHPLSEAGLEARCCLSGGLGPVV